MMTMFIKLENGEPVGDPIVEENFRNLFPGVSFSWPFVSEDIEPLGFGIYDFSSQPELATFEKAVEIVPVKDEYGRWIQAWAVEPMTDEEQGQRIEQEWDSVRFKRNMILARTDWTQLPDAPLTSTQIANWSSYRQALRDVTTQSDPFNITWPTKAE